MVGSAPKEFMYHFIYRNIPDIKNIKKIGGNIQYIGKYTNSVQASFTAPLSLKNGFQDPNLVHIERDDQISLPAYQILNPSLYQEEIRIVPAQNAKMICPWHIKKVIGLKRLASGSGVRVGVVDTGIDLSHPDLAQNIKGGINILSPSRAPYDFNGHGTHIAGTIGAAYGKGLVGVAPRVSLYPIKVLNRFGSGSVSNLVKGIEWGIANHMHILNVSISGGMVIPTVLVKAIQTATQKGIIIVSAAGNGGNARGEGDSVEIPARIPGTISVAAVTKNMKRATFSATGRIDISAPGVNILSAYSRGRYAILNGTSMAAAHVSGVLAIYKQILPEIGIHQLKRVLFKRSIPSHGKTRHYGHGFVQAR
ncbi:S8 family peptidase [Hazenella sp. IB182357]|uniref:S8 family peptidase n=1 Tax=Polycladospora coralii TaxID=2771432 RepID=A0A926N836_9BACL|nr:S8 family peptidase [Polycladospora coralii]MBD1370962.1 S8 family peptidase [Polycladospora coralii]MBS7529901.1 S8 family peptidase [Polycladospora coralii]